MNPALNNKTNTHIEIVSDIFLEEVNKLKYYAVFCLTQRTSTARINQLSKEKEEFKRFLKITHAKKFLHNLHLEDYLIQPLQRLCKYPLLFDVSF